MNWNVIRCTIDRLTNPSSYSICKVWAFCNALLENCSSSTCKHSNHQRGWAKMMVFWISVSQEARKRDPHLNGFTTLLREARAMYLKEYKEYSRLASQQARVYNFSQGNTSSYHLQPRGTASINKCGAHMYERHGIANVEKDLNQNECSGWCKLCTHTYTHIYICINSVRDLVLTYMVACACSGHRPQKKQSTIYFMTYTLYMCISSVRDLVLTLCLPCVCLQRAPSAYIHTYPLGWLIGGQLIGGCTNIVYTHFPWKSKPERLSKGPRGSQELQTPKGIQKVCV